MKDVDQAKKLLTAKSKRPQISTTLLSTGSTLLNLACSGDPNGGLPVGEYVYFVGDSNSGKTWYCMTLFAEANIDTRFADYRFIYDGPEGGAMMDIERYFGKGVKERLENKESDTIERFWINMDDAIKDGEPFIYVLDSMDALSSEGEIKKFQQSKRATEEDEKQKGSYGMDKPKLNSQNVRRVLSKLRKAKSILVVISQTRDNIGFGSMFDPKTRSGGHALVFYACIEIWTSIRERIKKMVQGKKRQLGIVSKIRVKRTRLTGKDRTVEIPIYHSSGLDDMGSCIDYLIDEGHWKTGAKAAKEGEKKAKGETVVAPEFRHVGSKEKLIQKIEADGLEPKLRELVGSVWQNIEDACVVKRKAKYT